MDNRTRERTCWVESVVVVVTFNKPSDSQQDGDDDVTGYHTDDGSSDFWTVGRVGR